MDGKVSPRLGIVILMIAATSFAANHVAARAAFDHGTTVAAAVVTRATTTALVLLLVMQLQRVAIVVPRAQVPRLLATGVMVAVQSYCLYSAIARIPAALALIVFQMSAMIYMLTVWAMGKEKAKPSALGPMLLALAGLALALDLRPEQLAVRWAELGEGILWALGAVASFVFVYYSNAFVLNGIDGRTRTCLMTAVTAVLMLVYGLTANAFSFPRDGTGWTGLVLLSVFYCIAMTMTFTVIPKVPSSTTVALNFEPIAALALAWLILGQSISLSQVVGCFMAVGAIAWMGGKKH
jgi:drug/metabolite transporter (DMT)-like permease